MIVYLCGPINGCTDAECNNWRQFATDHLKTEIRNPMVRDGRGLEMDLSLAQKIVEGDKIDIDASDVVLVNYVKPSVGTSMEVLYAWERGKTITVVCEPAAVLSPWLLYHSHKIMHSMREACDWINAL